MKEEDFSGGELPGKNGGIEANLHEMAVVHKWKERVTITLREERGKRADG